MYTNIHTYTHIHIHVCKYIHYIYTPHLHNRPVPRSESDRMTILNNAPTMQRKQIYTHIHMHIYIYILTYTDLYSPHLHNRLVPRSKSDRMTVPR